MDTESYFRTELMALMDDEQGIAWPTPLDHNTEYTVAGTTYARKIEIINGYKIQFSPNSQWSVRLSGSNNNLFDVQNGVLVQNQVQVIPNNSAGLQTVTSGSGLSTEQATRLLEIWQRLALDPDNPLTNKDDGSFDVGSIDVDASTSGDDIIQTRQ